MNRTKGPSLDTVQLSSGIHVPRKTHDDLFEHTSPRFDQLRFGKPYKGKEMIAPQFYAKHDPMHMGCCIADWERKKLIPVRFLGCPFCSVRYYERT